MSRYREARSGFTLTEVLMAMFVMAIGMISLLALFPVAFQNAKWALDNEQVARAAHNSQVQTETPRINVNMATGFVGTIQQSMRNDQMYNPDMSNSTMCWKRFGPLDLTSLLGRRSFLIDMFATPNGWTFDWNVNQIPPAPLANAKVMLPPVFVDPQIANDVTFIHAATGLPLHVGADQPATITPFRTNSLTAQVVGNAALRRNFSIGIPRVSSSQFFNDPDPSRVRLQNEYSMGDEIDFGPNGQPILNVSTTTYGRQRRFTWAYMCHWPDYNTKEVCDVTAIVFNSRPANVSGLATLPPGESTFVGNVAAAIDAGTDTAGLGRIFVKGLNQATVALPSAQPLPLRVNDWIMDSTCILPEYNENFPTEKAPFLDQFDPTAVYTFPQPMGGPHTLRPGVIGGHFYKVIDIGPLKSVGGVFFQTITIDRPAKSDGFSATVLAGVADVITKSVGRMPHR
ncbi:MAG: prepilin-type N-terminal cleavage/methylation domain-containing protein [Gemmatales bacterium]